MLSEETYLGDDPAVTTHLLFQTDPVVGVFGSESHACGMYPVNNSPTHHRQDLGCHPQINFSLKGEENVSLGKGIADAESGRHRGELEDNIDYQ